MNNNERPDHLWVTTFFSRASWTFYALTHFDGTVRIYMYISYIWKIHPIGSCLFFLLFLLSFDRKVYQACIYIRVLPLVATRHFSPAPRRSACGRPRNKERKNKVRLHSIDSARSSVSSLFSSERKRRPLRSRGSPVWFVTIDQLYTLGVSRRVVYFCAGYFAVLAPTWQLFFNDFWNFGNLCRYTFIFILFLY